MRPLPVIVSLIGFLIAHSVIAEEPNKQLLIKRVKEIVPKAEFYDFGLLERTLVHNYDARWEWYPNPGEVFSVGVFYKHFKDPNLEIANEFRGVQAFPTTAFYDARGRRTYTHPGVYASQGALERDIDEAGDLLALADRDPARDQRRREVDLAHDGETGLELARSTKHDLLIVDVMLPKMDGWAVLSALKADPDLADIPVVMLTIVDDKNLGYALGASDYLTKPIEFAALEQAIGRVPEAGVPFVLPHAMTRR